jgi:hypothetical protein
VTLDVDGVAVGVRVSSEGLLELLRQAFGTYVADGAEAAATLSVRVGAPGDGGKAQGFHLLFHHAQRALRTRDPHRLVRALVAHVAAHEPLAEGILRLPGVALVRDGEALIACLAPRPSFDVIERRLSSNGLLLVDEPFILVDPTRGELVVPDPALSVDWSALRRVEDVVGGQRRVEPAAAPGRYPHVRWTYVLAEERRERLPPARGVLWGALLAAGLGPVSRGDAVRTLAPLVELVRPTAVSWQEVASGVWCEG